MKYFGIAGIVLLLILLDKLCLWLEKQGVLYYRKQKPSSGSLIGAMLLEMQQIFNPGTQNVIEIKQHKKVKQIESNFDKGED